MTDFANILKSAFDFLVNNKLYGISIIYWLVALVVIGAIMSFITGNRGDKN